MPTTSARDRGDPFSSSSASCAGGTNELSLRRLALCVSSGSSAASTTAAIRCLTAPALAGRPTRFMIVLPLWIVKGPATAGTRYQAREIVAGLWATKLSAHDLNARNPCQHPLLSPKLSNSGESSYARLEHVRFGLAGCREICHKRWGMRIAATRSISPPSPTFHPARSSRSRSLTSRRVRTRKPTVGGRYRPWLPDIACGVVKLAEKLAMSIWKRRNGSESLKLECLEVTKIRTRSVNCHPT